MKGSSLALITITLSLILGAFTYFMTRSESVYLNQWMVDFGLGSVLQFFQAQVNNADIPHWMIYSLPDALWMLALTLFILMIWDFKLHKRSIPWIALAIIIGILFEIAQRFHMIPGRFDVIDLISIMLAALLPVSFIILKMRLWKTN